MISVLLLVKLTVILALGGLALTAPRVLTPAARHFLCLTALAVSLLLPFAPSVAPLPAVPVFSFISSSAIAIAPASEASVHWARLVWLAGLLLVSARFFLGLLVIWRKASPAVPWPSLPLHLQPLIDHSSIKVKIAPVATPLVWGWLHPEILLPESALAWPEDRLRLALLHELAHVSRRDIWAGLITAAARAVYWFHPLVWWLATKAAEQQELACDDRVLAAGVSVEEYAALLVDTARRLTSTPLFGCPMISHSHALRGRIMHILQFRPTYGARRYSRSATLFFSALLLGAALSVPAAVDHPAQTNAAPVYKIGGDVSAPTLISKVEPAYTESAKNNKIEGAVLLSVVIDSSGVPRNIVVMRGLGSGLDESAIEAITHWRFSPGRKNGQPVAVRANVEVNFRLK